MSREAAHTADHWSHAHVVQEMGWRPWLTRSPLPQWRRTRTDAELLDEGQTRLLVWFDVLQFTFLAWVTSLVGLHSMSDGSLPGEWIYPAAAAVSAALLSWFKGQHWPPVPEWERYPDHVADDAEDDDPKSVNQESVDPGDVTTDEDADPFTAWEMMSMILLLPLLLVGSAVILVVALVAVLAAYVVRRGWPALVVVALLATVAPYASLDEVGFTLFATFVITSLFACFVVWPLQRWCDLPTPNVGRLSNHPGLWRR